MHTQKYTYSLLELKLPHYLFPQSSSSSSSLFSSSTTLAGVLPPSEAPLGNKTVDGGGVISSGFCRPEVTQKKRVP